jgi:hypothetical protein
MNPRKHRRKAQKQKLVNKGLLTTYAVLVDRNEMQISFVTMKNNNRASGM